MITENKGINEALFHYMIHSIEATPFYQLLGIELQTVEPGQVVMAVRAENKHTNPMGFLHGGLIMSIADAAMGNAIRSLGITAVTVDCSTSFPGSGTLNSEIKAYGKVVRAGKQMIFAEATVYSGDKLIGHCKGSFYKIGVIDV